VLLEANWEIIGCVGSFFRYSFKLSTIERSKSSGASSVVVWSIVSPIPGSGVARSRPEASVYALVSRHQPSLF
jgi:hypothetical protein